MSYQLAEIDCVARKTRCKFSCFADWQGIGDESRAAKTEVLGNSQTGLQRALSLPPRRH